MAKKITRTLVEFKPIQVEPAGSLSAGVVALVVCFSVVVEKFVVAEDIVVDVKLIISFTIKVELTLAIVVALMLDGSILMSIIQLAFPLAPKSAPTGAARYSQPVKRGELLAASNRRSG